MQVANALNNNIRILFNPKVEAFKLFDFLIVKSNEDRYIAQIIEIYDDKFDSSQNVAKLKLFYKITENNEVMPYDNFTPNKECEIVKIKQEEIENFINQDKETFIFATNTKNSCSLKVQYDFFNKGAIVLADKIENANAISLNLAKNLSSQKHAIIIDSTGVIDFEGIKKIKASKDFKMPLNYTTIDFIFEKCLADASLEFQAIGGEIINEIKKFARKQEAGFIPFNAFTRVLLEQYKATPYPELKLLLVRLKKYQMDEIFARSKKDKETLFKTIEKNPIAIVDLSGVEASWQKAYLEYIVEDLKDEVYLITRINEENCDVDLINKIYNEKRNIKFIPNVSYNYKKLPSIMQYCKNYVLLPSLYQRTDFLDANFALSNLISEGCIIFGENTDNFLYCARDYELEVQEKRKNYRKIALSLVSEDEEQEANEAEASGASNEQPKTDSERLMAELSRFEEENLKKEVNENFEKEISEVDSPETDEEKEFEEIENPKITSAEHVPEEKDDFFEDVLPDTSAQEIKKESNDEFQELDNAKETKEDETPEEKTSGSESFEDILKDEEKAVQEPKDAAPASADAEESKDSEEESALSLDADVIEIDSAPELEISNDDTQIKAEAAEEALEPKKDENKSFDDFNLVEFGEQAETPAESLESENQESDEIELSDEELDFFQIAKESSIEYEKDSPDTVEYKTQNDPQDDDDIDLSDIANSSLDSSFEQIINTKNAPASSSIEIDENTKINAEILEQPVKNDTLPIFKEEIKSDDTPEFEVGNIILHKKYGRGTVTKTIQYEQRQLVQVEFEESGKKLLDPKVADIKLEQ